MAMLVLCNTVIYYLTKYTASVNCFLNHWLKYSRRHRSTLASSTSRHVPPLPTPLNPTDNKCK